MLKSMKTALKWAAAIFSFILTMFSMSEAIKEKKTIEDKLRGDDK